MKDSRIHIADRHTVVAAFKVTGVSVEAGSETFNTLLRSITPFEKGPVRYGVEILLRSIPSPDSVTGKILETYISLIQSAGYGFHLDRFLRKMDVVEHILTSSGYEGVWVMKEDIESLHTSMLSGGLMGITSSPARTVYANLDSVTDALVMRYSGGESEAVSIIAYGCNDGVRTNTVVLASSAARISVLAKALDPRLRCCVRKLRNGIIGYLPARLNCINKNNDSSSDWGRKLPSLLPSSRIEFLANMIPPQPMMLGKEFIDNPEAIHLGNIPATGRKLTIPLNSAHSCVIVGRPGYGKSYLLGSLVKTLSDMNQHVIVADLIDSDFRAMANEINAAVFSQDRGDTSLDLNPFRVKGFSEQETQKLSTDFLLSAISMFAPQDTFLRDTVSAYYSESTNEAKGIWGFIQYFEQTFPKLNNYAGELQSNHIGALKSRLRKLQSCLSDREFCPDMILKNNAIIELEKMDSREDKAISLLFLLNFLIQIKRREAKSGVVTPTFLIVDEAAELLSGGVDKDIDVAGRNLRDMLLKVIRTCRKIGLYLICATQDYHSVADYFQQSHVRILMNNKYLNEMGADWEPYQLLLPKLKVGQCLIEMSEFSKPLLFQTPEFTFGPKMSDEMVTQYMRKNFPEYISGIRPYDVAVPVVSYILSQLSELKGKELEIWQSSFNLRDFVGKVLTASETHNILEDVLVEVKKIYVFMGSPKWFNFNI